MFVKKMEVLCLDVDPNYIARPSSVLRYMQETANAQMKEEKPSYKELLNDGYAFLLSRIRYNIYKPLFQYDNITINSWPCETKGANFDRCYQIVRDGEIVAEGYAIWALININDRKFVKVGEINFDNYSRGEALKINPPVRFKIPKEVELAYVGEQRIDYNDIDCNNHMNNTNYPDMICNFIPDIFNKRITSVAINYVAEVKYGEVIRVYMGQHENKYYFRTQKADGINIEAEITVDEMITE